MPLIATSFQSPMAGLVGYNGPNSLVSFGYNRFNSDRLAPNQWHSGVDFSTGIEDTDRGDSIRVAGHGTVVYAGVATGYGNVVVVQHVLANSQIVTTVYGHLDTILVGRGDVVQGQVIGTLGDTGGDMPAHLHFGVYLGALALPSGYVAQIDSTPNSAGFVDPIWFLSTYSRSDLDLYGSSANDSGRNAIYGHSLNDFIAAYEGNDYAAGRVGAETIRFTVGVERTLSMAMMGGIRFSAVTVTTRSMVEPRTICSTAAMASILSTAEQVLIRRPTPSSQEQFQRILPPA